MFHSLRSRWNEFFFAQEVPYGMALTRITLPLVLLIGAIPRWWWARELYSSDGSPAPLWVSYGSSPLLPDLPAPVAVAMATILIVSLVTASIGWMTRWSLVVSCVLYACLGIIDSMSTLTKYTVVASHVLLLLALSNCGAIWSVDAWLARRRQSQVNLPAAPPLAPVWPQRLVQLFIGIVYLGAAVTKMHTPAYFSGDQLTFWMLSDINFENPFGEFLSMYPSLLTIMAYVTIIWEVLFVFTTWSRFWRIPTLVIGLVFHLMTYFTLGLIIFPLLYCATYLAFLDPSEVEWTAVRFRRIVRSIGLGVKRRVPSRAPSPAWMQPTYAGAAWALLLATSAVIGVEVEHQRDVYQRRGENGPLSLTAMDPQLVKTMLSPAQPIRPQDMYFALDVGTSTMGGVLSNRRDTFAHGERALIQCTLQPPHPDMWVEVNLHDADDALLRRVGTVIPREDLRASFFYDLDGSLLPGKYDFVLKYDGQELTRRSITLSGPSPKLTASR
ncbi:MAG: HTTM domain-containing protein [Planctomycetaceae bacterium]|nr:HTTM domain-containing protein [Planctomycetaceae bacterium]